MFARASRRRAVAALAAASLCLLLATRPLPLAAHDRGEAARAAAGAAEPDPGFVERQAGPAAGKKGGRLLPTLLGLAVAGVVVVVLVKTVFRQTGYDPHIIPLEFVAGVGNAFFPVVPGRTRTYAAAAPAGETVTLTVDDTVHTKMVMGVLCLGVHERTANAEWLLEDTWRWYAQDERGDVWYFAGETKKYDHEAVTMDLSWQAGSDGAEPGRVMLGKPQDFLGQELWQAYAPGKTEEKIRVVLVGETVAVPAGVYAGCVKVKAFSGPDPGAFEHRYYAPGVGLVLCEEGATGKRRLELTGIQ